MARLLAEIGVLGKRTAELHLALSSDSDDPAFAPEPFTMQFQNNLGASFAELTQRTLRLLRARLANVPAEYKDKASEIAAREHGIIRAFRTALSIPIEAMRIRVETNPHAPPKFRVNGPVSNMPEFAAAFGCSAGAPMVRRPDARCEVW